jgi:hypothetical protein
MVPQTKNLQQPRVAGTIPKPFLCGSRSSPFALLKALAAKYRASLGRLEWDRSFALAPGTNRLGFYPLVVSSPLRKTERLGAFFLAPFTALGFVLELFVVEEKLFTGREHEICAAVNTLQNLILELH